MPPYPTTTLRNGDRGEAVRKLQSLLNRDYPAYSHLVEDGEFGAMTESVVREFQRRAGLKVTGVAGPETLAKLDELTVHHDDELKDCGGGVFAGSSTSCQFAHNVHTEYFAVPGDSIEIKVFSPVTQQNYIMACIRDNDWVTCRGGNNALVEFSYTRQ